LRIIAGRFRGHRLEVPETTRVRPTKDRVREAIFNMLARTVIDVDVLDLFAGSGALGLEAISRGAAGCTFVERSPKVMRVIQNNARTLDVVDQCQFVLDDVVTFLRKPVPASAKGRYSLVFLDPPYDDGFPQDVLGQLARWEGLAHPALLVVESAKRFSPRLQESECIEAKLRVMRRRTYGSAVATILKHEGEGDVCFGETGDVPR